MLKSNFSPSIVSIILYVTICNLLVYGQVEQGFYRFVDSADVYLDNSSDKALRFLDSIPSPIEDYIPGRVTEYYSLKAIIYDDYNEFIKHYQSANLAIKFAEIEKEYCIGGEVCISMFSNLYFMDKQKLAYTYLDKAKSYYNNCEKYYSIFEVEQVEAYAKYLDGKHEESNSLLLNKIDKYKEVREDPYYHMFGLYIVCSNYIWLDSLEEAHKYFNYFKELKANPNIAKVNYYAFEGAINSSLADVYLNKKDMDSTLFYLKETSKLKKFLSIDVVKEYYKLYSDYYKDIGVFDASKVYSDSLFLFQNELYEKTIENSIEISNALLIEGSEEMGKQDSKYKFSTILGGASVVVLLTLIVFCFVLYRKQKKKLLLSNLENSNNLSYLKSNNDQLATKVFGLESYIKNLKNDIKQISVTEGVEFQKDKIKELYRNLHINTSTLLDKTSNHLELVNEFNIEFFNKIKTNYPQLKKTETVICYYLLMGFSNKEIAVFLNTTIRSVESRRYRISKKIEFNNDKETLLEFLENTFASTLSGISTK
ncbi:helix-turn-helix transcriptional regulator [Algibacter pectinivorans]|uniref:Regulatory protein, luxR family n=1 Tax=Algibacter pectinivorans TaxID=870482 RepID=A0A1I1QT06_9FLAO|nr:LuxR C-terminal-related transcriptional regulator [Algibacter pectinivorans]SFD25254.1 regulatory protein, luxR family [Algibacter pectinivorans]